jgi:hypothetical protein
MKQSRKIADGFAQGNGERQLLACFVLSITKLSLQKPTKKVTFP